MLHITRSISKFVFSFFTLGAVVLGCAHGPTKNSETVLKKASNQRVYFNSYEAVWRAAQLALKYPISVNNIDNGILETEYIRGVEGFQPPDSTDEPSQGVRYKISLILVKGKTQGRDSVRVTVSKNIEKKRDFFSEPEQLPSDGLEEKVIFYRIERELAIDEAIKKSAKNESSPN